MVDSVPARQLGLTKGGIAIGFCRGFVREIGCYGDGHRLAGVLYFSFEFLWFAFFSVNFVRNVGRKIIFCHF